MKRFLRTTGPIFLSLLMLTACTNPYIAQIDELDAEYQEGEIGYKQYRRERAYLEAQARSYDQTNAAIAIGAIGAAAAVTAVAVAANNDGPDYHDHGPHGGGGGGRPPGGGGGGRRGPGGGGPGGGGPPPR